MKLSVRNHPATPLRQFHETSRRHLSLKLHQPIEVVDRSTRLSSGRYADATMSKPNQRGASLVRAMRPRQWLKNLLVLTAPLAAGVVTDGDTPLVVGLTFVAFSLVASAGYLLNDVRDAQADRLHPTKRRRPVASGELSPATALGGSAVLGSAGLVLGFTVDRELGLTLAVYLAMVAGYSLWLKHLAVVDLAVVSSGFLLRAVAGGVAVNVPLSQWFLLVAAFGSLFMVAGKRYSELRGANGATRSRRALEQYSESYLRFVWGMAATVTISAYCLWAFEISAADAVNWRAVSIAPFVVGLLRYAGDIDRGLAGEPEDAVVRDAVLLVLSLTWVVVFALGVYAT